MWCNLRFIEFMISAFLEDCFSGTHPLHSFQVNTQNIEWNYSILSCFINNFGQTEKDNHLFIAGVTRKDYHAIFTFLSIVFLQACFVNQIRLKTSVHANINFFRLCFTPKESFYYSFSA